MTIGGDTPEIAAQVEEAYRQSLEPPPPTRGVVAGLFLIVCYLVAFLVLGGLAAHAAVQLVLFGWRLL